MGLLDDAIREHLDLKRRRGADPGEVAREQHEALDLRAGVAHEDDIATQSAEPAVAGTSGEDAPANAPHTDVAAPGETAELDMRTVLGEDEEISSTSGAPTEGTSGEGESLEWEMPGDGPAEESTEEGEDVLEETPEFLRDTPEQERLWFEQRPPRDFDFDK